MIHAEAEYFFIQHQSLNAVAPFIIEKREKRLVFEVEEPSPVSSSAPTTPVPDTLPSPTWDGVS